MKDGYWATCISYVSSGKFVIEFSDGFTTIGRKWQDFIEGRLVLAHFRHLLMSKVITAKNGQNMRIVAYHSYNNIDVAFDDGTIVTNQRVGHFLKGCIVHPTNKIKTQTSINEYTMLFYLRQLNFEKASMGSLKEYGFGRMELDAFNRDYKIAIEYDGEVHKFRENSDVKKENLCKKNNINFIAFNS